jgi:hypothetical protein
MRLVQDSETEQEFDNGQHDPAFPEPGVPLDELELPDATDDDAPLSEADRQAIVGELTDEDSEAARRSRKAEG